MIPPDFSDANGLSACAQALRALAHQSAAPESASVSANAGERKARKKRPGAGAVKKASPGVDVFSRAPDGRHFPDNPGPLDHVLFLHGGVGSSSRWVALRRLSDKEDRVNLAHVANRLSMKVRVDQLSAYINDLSNEPSLYLTQSDFHWGKKDDKDRHRTTAQYIKSIGVIFVDLDIYNSPTLIGLSPEQLRDRVLQCCDQARLPRPVLIHSGRGLYVNWKLTERLHVYQAKQRTRWQLLQQRLMSVLREFMPDTKVRDTTRVLRLLGTINTRSQTRVRLLYDDGKTHQLEHLERALEHVDASEFAPATQTKKGPDKRPAAAAGPEGPVIKVKAFLTGSPNATHNPSLKVGHHQGDTPPLGSRDLTLLKLRERKKPSVSHDPNAPAWRAPKRALRDLDALIRADAPLVAGLSRQRAHHYRLFCDIARVIQMRGGIAQGARDEFIFWLLITRYNAGLYHSDLLPELSKRFSALTQGSLDLWQAGMLSSVHARMRAQEGTGVVTRNQRRTVVAVPGTAFSAIAYHRLAPASEPTLASEAERGQSHQARAFISGPAPKGGYVYTPRIDTLIDRLGISAHEQSHLDVLAGAQERKARKQHRSAHQKRLVRNASLRERLRLELDTSTAEKPVSKALAHLAKQAGVSQSSAYRIGSDLIQSHQRGRRKHHELKRQQLLALREICPGVSLRSLAHTLGIALSTASRWVRAHCLSANQSDHNAINSSSLAALGATFLTAHPHKTQPINTTEYAEKIGCDLQHQNPKKDYKNKGVEHGFSLVLSPAKEGVPLSHSGDYSRKGLRVGRGEGVNDVVPYYQENGCDSPALSLCSSDNAQQHRDWIIRHDVSVDLGDRVGLLWQETKEVSRAAMTLLGEHVVGMAYARHYLGLARRALGEHLALCWRWIGFCALDDENPRKSLERWLQGQDPANARLDVDDIVLSSLVQSAQMQLNRVFIRWTRRMLHTLEDRGGESPQERLSAMDCVMRWGEQPFAQVAMPCAPDAPLIADSSTQLAYLGVKQSKHLLGAY